MAAPWILCLLVTLVLPAQDFSKLPGWAAAEAQAAALETQPADARAWVLLSRTEIAYTGDGEIIQRHCRLVKILEDGAINAERVFILRGLGGGSSKVNKLKGWNLRPDGTLVKVEWDHVVTVPDDDGAELSTGTRTIAILDRVAKGSYLAFEALETYTSPCGPVADVYPMEDVPIRRWELVAAKKEGWFTNLKDVDVKMAPCHFQPWFAQVEPLAPAGFRVSGLPALPMHEDGHPNPFNLWPSVQVRFLDPAIPTARMWGTWDGVGSWYAGAFTPATAVPSGAADFQGRSGLEGLRALWTWMGKTMIYKQVYLTPARGWLPERAEATGRKRYGDCKDLSAFFIAEASRLGFQGFPVLARIVDGEIEPGGEPFPVTNHAIAALKLPVSLGLPAEVDTPKGRFLLVDATDPDTPLGYLGSFHAGRRVMVCLPEGAQWLTIPDRAILQDHLGVDLKEELQGTSLHATLRLQETGHYWHLRALAHRGGAKAVRDHLLAKCLDLPPDAQVTVTRMGEPLDLERPFEVDVDLIHPKGFLRKGTEWNLAGLALPWMPGLIQKAGTRRVYPVAREDSGDLTYHASLSVPVRVTAVAPDQTRDTAFRSFHWQARAVPEGAGTRIELSLDQHLKPAAFGFGQQDQGLRAWKEDRAVVKALWEDGLAFKDPAP